MQLAVSLVAVAATDNADDGDGEISDKNLPESKLIEVWNREPLVWLKDYEKGDRHLWNQKRRLWLKDYERGDNEVVSFPGSCILRPTRLRPVLPV